MTAARLVARCIRGLEPTLAAEILHHGLGTVTQLGHREVHFRTESGAGTGAGAGAGTLGAEPQLRTADDVFLFAAQLPDPGPGRSGLDGLAGLAGSAARVADRRTGRAYTGVEVSASFLGRRNFSRYDAEDAVGHALARRLGVGYHSRRDGAAPPPGHLGWRLTLDGVRATLLLRSAERPLHRRPYKQHTVPGTLHPPLAAAMARMAGIRAGHRVLDPCCGAGTLLIEARETQPGARFDGFDLDPRALRAARANAASASASVRDGRRPIGFERADAAGLPLPDGNVDRVLSNPPWGTQVSPHGLLAGHPARWWGELRRVLVPDGQAVVLLPESGDLAVAIRQGFTPVHIQRVRLAGAQPYVVQLMAEQWQRQRDQQRKRQRGQGQPGR